jgi:ketosteroid isomerase-like protein
MEMIGAVLLCAFLTPQAIATGLLGSGQVESKILGLEDKWRVAQHRNDVEAFMALLSPALTFIGTSGSLRDRSDFIASRVSSWIPRAATYECSELRVRVFGPVAVVTGREATTGDGVAFQGRFTHVWAEQAGDWRLVAIHRTDILPASPTK